MSISIGTPFQQSAKKSGTRFRRTWEEVVIELQGFGVEVIALDAYRTHPLCGSRCSHVVSMLDGDALRKIILEEKLDSSCPRWKLLPRMSSQNWKKLEKLRLFQPQVPVTMNREGIRRLAAEELGLKTALSICRD